jgi:catechol 2,3-dioxygenase-like lactoylglutathione lyase family enzyme
MATIRYLVNDVDSAIRFYKGSLGFELKQQFGPAMAILAKDSLILWLAGPNSSAAQPMPSGARPAPGGWNRFVLEVKDLPAMVEKLRREGVSFRSDLVKGPGGTQILCEDPSGNAIELFQPV